MRTLMKTDEVAERLNKPKQAIQAWIRNGTFPGGYCYVREGCKKHCYEVSRKVFEETFGVEDEKNNK